MMLSQLLPLVVLLAAASGGFGLGGVGSYPVLSQSPRALQSLHHHSHRQQRCQRPLPRTYTRRSCRRGMAMDYQVSELPSCFRVEFVPGSVKVGGLRTWLTLSLLGSPRGEFPYSIRPVAGGFTATFQDSFRSEAAGSLEVGRAAPTVANHRGDVDVCCIFEGVTTHESRHPPPTTRHPRSTTHHPPHDLRPTTRHSPLSAASPRGTNSHPLLDLFRHGRG